MWSHCYHVPFFFTIALNYHSSKFEQLENNGPVFVCLIKSHFYSRGEKLAHFCKQFLNVFLPFSGRADID